MHSRRLGKTGRDVSEIGFGAWQIGADWGDVAEDEALATLHAAADAGVTFFDTADVYGDGRSERLVGRLLHERGPGAITVATKMGRRARADRRELLAGELPRLERPVARERRRGRARPRPAALPADRRSTTTRRSSRTSRRWSPRAGSPPTG